MSKHFLAVDIGNTQMVFGLYQAHELICHWRLSSERHATPDELAWQIHGMFTQHAYAPKDIDGIMTASVVPHLDAPFSEACARICGREPAFVGSSSVRTGMAVDYKNPREVGADRIANAVAAREQFGSPVIVLDCGTATTFDIVSAEGHYAGGLIAPGMEVALAALSERAAKLPEVPLTRTDMHIGRDTISSMQVGSYWSIVDGLTGLIARLRRLADYEKAPVVATGGLARLVMTDIADITHYEEHLTLQGLHLLATRHFD
ncbi:MAG: type III pantothenate kinase [Mariprofundaceae bacterium]